MIPMHPARSLFLTREMFTCLRKETTVGLQNASAAFGSRTLSPRLATAVAAIVGITLGYGVATVANPLLTPPSAKPQLAQLPTVGAGAESTDNSRECDAAAGATSSCVFP